MGCLPGDSNNTWSACLKKKKKTADGCSERTVVSPGAEEYLTARSMRCVGVGLYLSYLSSAQMIL